MVLAVVVRWKSLGGSTGWFVLPNMFGANISDVGVPNGELYAQVISGYDGTDPYPGPWMFGANHPSGNDVCHYPFSPSGGQYVYEHFGAGQSGIRPNGLASVTLNAWRRVNIWSAQFDWKMMFDDVTGAAWQTNTTNPDVRWTQAPVVGANFGGHRGAAFPWPDQQLVPVQRQTVCR